MNGRSGAGGSGGPGSNGIRAYRIALYAFPATFRGRWGAAMESMLLGRLAETPAGIGRSVILLRAIADAVVQGLAERVTTFRARSVPTRARNGGTGAGSNGGFALGSVLQDARHAVRSVRRSPGFAWISIVTLALGVGATTAVFTVVNAILLRPLPYPAPDRLVAVWPVANFNTAMVRRVAESVPALESVTGISIWTMTVTGDGGEPEEIDVGLVSANHFDVLRVSAALGRTFVADEGLKGGGDVAVLSWGFWMRRYGGDRSIIGRRIPLAGADHDVRTVIGVLPESFLPAVDVGEPMAWVPLEDDPSLTVATDNSWYVNWRVGRLAPGATVAQAESQLRASAGTLRMEAGTTMDEEDVRQASIEPLRAYRIGRFAGILWVLLGAVSLVLLIACANVANLLLARGETRFRELAVRRALGARPGRVIRQLLTESAVLALAGGALGIALAYALVRLMVLQAPPELPDTASISIDPIVIAFAAGVSMLSAIVFGIAPALRAGGSAAAETLRQGVRGAVGVRSRHGVSSTLVGFEVALAVLLVVGSGLMLRTLGELHSVDPGFDPTGVLVLRPAPPAARYSEPVSLQQFHVTVLERIGEIPAVESAAAIQLLPITFGNWGFPVFVEGVDVPEGTSPPSANFRVVTPGYFETMRIPLMQGRTISRIDLPSSQRVAVVNSAFVNRYWPDANPIGRTIRIFSPDGDDFTIVGVVGDVNQSALDIAPRPEMYVANEQSAWLVPMYLVVRVAGDPMRLAPAIRDAIRAVEPETAISGLELFTSVIGRSAATTRFLTLLLGLFGLLALVLGGVGVYGVTAYTVERRVPEFGVRLALGASHRSVLLAAFAGAIWPVIAGITAGILSAAVAAGFVESMLFGVAPRDPLTFAGVPILLFLVAMGAILLPAWRATRVDPLSVLKTE